MNLTSDVQRRNRRYCYYPEANPQQSAHEAEYTHIHKSSQTQEPAVWDFPGGPAVKSLLANAGNMGSISDPGKSHMLWGS